MGRRPHQEASRLLGGPKAASSDAVAALDAGYRNINESYRLATWNSMGNMSDLPSLLIVQNSSWIAWLVAESGGVLQADKLTPYAIYSPEDCIDVVTEFEPEVSWLNE